MNRNGHPESSQDALFCNVWNSSRPRGPAQAAESLMLAFAWLDTECSRGENKI